jgi:hypothetical protein
MLRTTCKCVVAWLVVLSTSLRAEIEPITGVERQPLEAQVERVVQALQYVGSPLPPEDVERLEAARGMDSDRQAIIALQQVLDAHCLAVVSINPESRVSAVAGPVNRELVQQGWRTFLLKVHNEARITPELRIGSPQSAPVYQTGSGARQQPQTNESLVDSSESARRFLDIESFGKQPLTPELSGLEVEYRIVQLYSRDVGRREATLTFDVGQGTQDLGFRSELPVLFECVPAVEVVLGVYDQDGSPTTAAFTIRDTAGRVYPNPARRLAPDFFFHNQIYRAHGESVQLPPGEYTVNVQRGPEYHVITEKLVVADNVRSQKAEFRLHRWIHPAEMHWYSGDHHVHAAGCKHYDSPTEGVSPGDMLRHIVGEDLNVGCVLSWGPCWYTQKQYFEGKTSALSLPRYLMRYDVEVSGFPSSHAGHLCLLNLSEDDYPGSTVIEEWPSWTLPVLKWGQEQDAVVGYSHSGWGLGLPDYGPNGERLPVDESVTDWQSRGGRAADTLPDYAMPPFDGIGANEYIVTTALGACDFISAVDTPAIWELNIWYHTLNCGMTSRISGETDFPCIYGDKVGLGRIYVKLGEEEELTYENWVRGLKTGRSYCGDGLSHILDFRATDVAAAEAGSDASTVLLGEPGSDGHASVLALEKPGRVRVAFHVAAMLEEQQNAETERIRNARLDAKPYWHIERCRIGDSRMVPVELIVNGEVAERFEFEADGHIGSREVELDIAESSWVAVRILPSVHTNPIWVTVGDEPVRSNRRSAEWCLQAVDTCWEQKRGQIRESERAEAEAAYEQARAVYRDVLESFAGE